ncbi:hypothetical protein [Pedobacter cryoconitis]|uniref:Uncharacterized protein n=1 Tax=Pedobacter cryoconitis TaxID=188932 RepID=A0A327S196_9SPHI|nr:hypothetical protein [Pedobacter cryoconitis]RAJ22880.1 hypothetical protein LY11_04584 [Pedobacter cryoconitis]
MERTSEEIMIAEINQYLLSKTENTYRHTSGKSVFKTAGREYTRYQYEVANHTNRGIIDLLVSIVKSDEPNLRISGFKIVISPEQVFNNEFYNLNRDSVDKDIQVLETYINTKR